MFNAYWQVTLNCYLLAPGFILLLLTGNWLQIVAPYWQRTSNCYSLLANAVKLLLVTGKLL